MVGKHNLVCLHTAVLRRKQFFLIKILWSLLNEMDSCPRLVNQLWLWWYPIFHSSTDGINQCTSSPRTHIFSTVKGDIPISKQHVPDKHPLPSSASTKRPGPSHSRIWPWSSSPLCPWQALAPAGRRLWSDQAGYLRGSWPPGPPVFWHH